MACTTVQVLSLRSFSGHLTYGCKAEIELWRRMGNSNEQGTYEHGCENGSGSSTGRVASASEASRGSTCSVVPFKGSTGSTRLGKLYLELKLLFSASITLPSYYYFFRPLASCNSIPSVLERKLPSLLEPG